MSIASIVVCHPKGSLLQKMNSLTIHIDHSCKVKEIVNDVIYILLHKNRYHRIIEKLVLTNSLDSQIGLLNLEGETLCTHLHGVHLCQVTGTKLIHAIKRKMGYQ